MSDELTLIYLVAVGLAVFYIILSRAFSRNNKQGTKYRPSSKNISDGSESAGYEKDSRAGSLIEDPVLLNTPFLSDDEKEEQVKFSRPFIQPLTASLFDRDKRDDLTRSIFEDDKERSFNLFELDKKDDLTR